MLYIPAAARMSSPITPTSFLRSVLALHSVQHIHRLSTPWRARTKALRVHNGIVPSTILPIHRTISTVSAILLPPLVFSGLVVTLWTWKCFMMVLFQNKIIYMPFLPPNARSDTIDNYDSYCGGVKWKEEHIRSADGTDIALVVTEIGSEKEEGASAKEKVVLYFQGNASSLPPRLPAISQVIRLLIEDNPSLRLKFIGVSYRGYWKSGGKASEAGMHQDAEAALQYAISSSSLYHATCVSSPPRSLKVVIWGQSIGCAFASHLAAGMIKKKSSHPEVELETLILETPFTSASEMLKTLYPQKWLPYHYLSVFLWNRLDTVDALGQIKSVVEENNKRLDETESRDNSKRLDVVMLEGEKDELVQAQHGDEIEALMGKCEGGEVTRMAFKRITVEGALHTQVLAKGSGRIAAAEALRGHCDSAV